MNNLAIVAVLLASSGLVFLAQRTSLQHVRAENQRLTRLVASTQRATEDADGRFANLSRQVEAQRNRQIELRSGLASEAPAGSAIPFEPEKEGIWPIGKPYFYLKKSRLADAVFQKFQGSARGLGLHSDTTLALGMTPVEASTIDNGFEDLVARFKDLEKERLEPSQAHASERWPGKKKTSYRMPPLREEMEPTIASYFASVRSALGDARAALFEGWARNCIAESVWDFAPKARLFTLTDEEFRGDQRLTRFEMAEESGKSLYYYELWYPPRDYGLRYGLPENALPRFPYRHLFGDSGEKRPGEPLSKGRKNPHRRILRDSEREEPD